MAFRHMIVAALLALTPGAQGALAHSFSVAIIAPDAAMADALAGFRVATRERDGHAAEDSDGHLGGLDVYMSPAPRAGDEAARGADLLLDLGGGAAAPAQGATRGGPLAMIPGALPRDWRAGAFGASYRAQYDRAPSMAAAQGYNAARRIDLAVRPLGGVEDRGALAAALAASRAGIDW